MIAFLGAKTHAIGGWPLPNWFLLSVFRNLFGRQWFLILVHIVYRISTLTMVYPLFISEYPRYFRYALKVKNFHVLDCWFYYEYISDTYSIRYNVGQVMYELNIWLLLLVMLPTFARRFRQTSVRFRQTYGWHCQTISQRI